MGRFGTKPSATKRLDRDEEIKEYTNPWEAEYYTRHDDMQPGRDWQYRDSAFLFEIQGFGGPEQPFLGVLVITYDVENEAHVALRSR